MKRITVIALAAAALLGAVNIDEANAGSFRVYNCEGTRMTWEQTDSRENKITVGSLEYPVSAGTMRFADEAGNMVTAQGAALNANDHDGIAVAFTRQQLAKGEVVLVSGRKDVPGVVCQLQKAESW